MSIASIRRLVAIAAATASVSGCGGSNNSTPPVSSTAGSVRVRFFEAAPTLETLVNGAVVALGSTAYLTVNGGTTSSQFPNGYLTAYLSFRRGTETLEVLDSYGYKVGPLKTDSLAAGKQYTVAIVGSYPNYKAVAFEDPAVSTSAQLTVYQVAPSFANVDFGSFRASTDSSFHKLGSAAYGSVASASLGKSVTDFGGYVGKNVKPFAHAALTLAAVNPFDQKNVLPFGASNRLSLFVIDPLSTSKSPAIVGSLDQ